MNKGTIEPGSALTNKFQLKITGLPTIYFVRFGELETELKLAKMPDLTWQTTGQVDPIEVEADHMIHHSAERVALEAWHAAAVAGAAGHKLPGMLHLLGADGNPVVSYLLDGVINKGRKIPELAVGNDGEGVVCTWKLAVDNVIPL